MSHKEKGNIVEARLRRLILGHKEQQGITWAELGEAIGVSRQVMQYRWSSAGMTLADYIAICDRLAVPQNEIYEVITNAKKKE